MMDTKNKLLDRLDNEGIKLSSNSNRIKSYIIDDLLITLIVLIVVWDNIARANDVVVAIAYLQTLVYEIMLIKLAYHTLFYWQYGATIGKRVAGIKVVMIDSMDKPDFWTALNRSGMRLISEMFFYFGFLLAFFDITKQTLHDRLARTIVVDVQNI